MGRIVLYRHLTRKSHPESLEWDAVVIRAIEHKSRTPGPTLWDQMQGKTELTLAATAVATKIGQRPFLNISKARSRSR